MRAIAMASRCRRMKKSARRADNELATMGIARRAAAFCFERSKHGGAMTQNVVQNVGGGNAFSEEGTFAPGQISISARVTVTFDLE
jgi:hypothetical protein